MEPEIEIILDYAQKQAKFQIRWLSENRPATDPDIKEAENILKLIERAKRQ